jgi:two-component system, sensor histidine kinase ChiS
MLIPRSKASPAARVLIAFEDPAFRAHLTSILESNGCYVVALRDGREALRVLSSNSDFKGVVFNLSLQHVNGLELASYMRTEKRLMRIPVMMIAAESDTRLLARWLAAGAAVLLTKPFTEAQLKNTLQMMLASKLKI